MRQSLRSITKAPVDRMFARERLANHHAPSLSGSVRVPSAARSRASPHSHSASQEAFIDIGVMGWSGG